MVEFDENEEYEKELQEAEDADLDNIEGLGICKLIRDEQGNLVPDKDGNVIVTVMPSLIPRTSDNWEKSFKLFLRETKEICRVGYRLIFIYSGFYPPLWFGWWMLRLRRRVSDNHSKNLMGITIIHPSVALRFGLLSISPFIGNDMWNKMQYVDRIEELWIDEIMSEDVCRQNLPRSVFVYEGVLEEHSEEARRLAISHGAPLARRER